MAGRFSRLDRSSIRRLQAGAKLAEHGIVVERLADGDCRYAVNIMVDRELATLSHLFSMSAEWRWLDRVPARPKKLGENAARIIALTDEECDALIRAATAHAAPDLWLFIAFGLNTAMRHAEILSARWEHLDLGRHRLFIPGAKAGEREQRSPPNLPNC
jgi:integrase